MLFAPEGPVVAWNVNEGRAVSQSYNTLDFATPLVELPIDKITEQEQAEYTRFRGEYMNLWRQYFDPVGMRLKMTDGRVKLETYILPLIENTSYNELRRFTGRGTTTLDPAQRSPRTVALFVQHLAQDFEFVRGWGGGSFAELFLPAVNFLGDWFLVRVDDSPIYAKLAKMLAAAELGLEEEQAVQSEQQRLE